MTSLGPKNPSAMFYWMDHESDPELKSCSLAAQGLWMRMLCIAARSPEPGVVIVKGQPSRRQDLPSVLARQVGQPPEMLTQLLDELITSGTAGVDPKRRIYCRRMLRAAALSHKRSEIGKKGADVTHGKKRDVEGLPWQNGGQTDGKGPSKEGGPSRLHDLKTSNQPQPPSPVPRDGARWGPACKAVIRARWPNDAKVEMMGTGLASQWVANGYDLELDVLPIVRQLVADKRGDAITNLKYFSDAIARRYAERTAPAACEDPDGELRLRDTIERLYSESGKWQEAWKWREHWGIRPDRRAA